MNTRILEKVGLTEAESRVYLGLLKLGASTVGKIIKESGTSNSKIYDILERLNKKGLVGKVILNNKRSFEAKDPSRIRELVQTKREEIDEVEKIIPKLEELKEYSEPTQEAEILQGINGIKTFNEILLRELEKGDIFYIMGAPKESSEILGAYFQEWHQRRANKGIHCKIIYTHDAEQIAKKRDKIALTEVRTLPKEIKTMANIVIGKDYVGTALFGERPLVVVINNKQIYESYLQFFNLMWKASKKP